MPKLELNTSARSQLVDITDRVQKMIADHRMADGLCHLWIPHTTAGLTVNENADPDVAADILMQLDRMVPWENGYRHGEGNSAAHVKSSLMGCQLTVPVSGGRLALGTWQGIYFCEFDGPRRRQVWLELIQRD